MDHYCVSILPMRADPSFDYSGLAFYEQLGGCFSKSRGFPLITLWKITENILINSDWCKKKLEYSICFVCLFYSWFVLPLFLIVVLLFSLLKQMSFFIKQKHHTISIRYKKTEVKLPLKYKYHNRNQDAIETQTQAEYLDTGKLTTRYL